MTSSRIPYSIRPANPAEIPALVVLEDASGILFKGTGLIPEGEPDLTIEATLHAGCEAGLACVATDVDNATLFGFVVCEEEGSDLYLYQISVHPDFGRQGIGQALIAHVFEEARRRSKARVTLSTFCDVAWNRPYYARLGFTEINTAEHAPYMTAIRDAEATFLDITKRCFMACGVGEERL